MVIRPDSSYLIPQTSYPNNMRSLLAKKEKDTQPSPFFSKERNNASFFSKANTSFFQPSGNTASKPFLDDKHNLTSSTLAGNEKLEKCFDGDKTIKAPDDGDHVAKLQTGLVELGFDLPVFGIDGKFGNETKTAVKEFQISAGMSPSEQDGKVGRKTIGILDLSLRNSKVDADPDKADKDFIPTDEKKEEKDNECKGKPSEQACPLPNDSVNQAADQATKMIDKVLDEQLPPKTTDEADYPAIFDKIFRNNDPGTQKDKADKVRENYVKIKTFIGTLKTNPALVRCGTACDGGCRSGSPAYHTQSGGNHLITFCPDFDTHKEKILILLHESHHAAIDGSLDFAYAFTRLFDKLDHNKALKNAASFHIYAALVDKPGSESIGPKVKDTNTIDDPQQKARVDLALAFMDQWFTLIPFDISGTVRGAQRAREKGKYVDNNPRIFIELVFSKWFGVTRPPTVPTKKDVTKLRAIEDRTKLMRQAFKSPFVILPTPDNSFWERGPGSGIALNNALLNLDMQHMVIALLQELVHATPDISAESEPLYVGTLNDMRNLRDLDP